MSAEIQESLNNFKVTIAFNRRDYFRKRFEEVNRNNYTTAMRAGLANNFLLPVYNLFSGIAQLIVLALWYLPHIRQQIYSGLTGELLGLCHQLLQSVTAAGNPVDELPNSHCGVGPDFADFNFTHNPANNCSRTHLPFGRSAIAAI